MLCNFVVSRTVCFIDLGSNDGHVCLWKCGENFRSLELCFTVPLVRHMILFKNWNFVGWKRVITCSLSVACDGTQVLIELNLSLSLSLAPIPAPLFFSPRFSLYRMDLSILCPFPIPVTS